MAKKVTTLRPCQYAKLMKTSPQNVNNLIRRKKVKTTYDKKLNLRLIVVE